MKLFRFLKDKWFYISLIIMLLIIIGVLEYTFSSLDKFTRHGEEFEVPNMVGMSYDEAVEKYQDEFSFILLDSIYVKDFPEGAVYQQNPASGAKVKQGRNIYIIRTTVAPEIIEMPNLRNLSLRQALVRLNMAGLKVDKLEYVDYFARNAVVEQKIKNKVIEPKEDVVKGSAITLVVGLGNGTQNTNIPDLIGTQLQDVKGVINNASLNIGTEIFIDNDVAENLYVIRMEPEYSAETMVPLGSTINVWYKSIKNFDFNWYKYEKFRRDSMAEVWRVRKFNADTIKYLVDSFNYILKNRKFSYDSIQRLRDMEMMFLDWEAIRAVRIDTILDDLEFLLDDDYEIDTSFFYDE